MSAIRRKLALRRKSLRHPSGIKTVLIETRTIGGADFPVMTRAMTTVSPKHMENWPKKARANLSGTKTLTVCSLRERDELFHELSLSLQLSGGHHRNIIRFYPYFFISSLECGLLMEVSNTTLFNYSQSLRGDDHGETQTLLVDGCTGLLHLHDLGFVHNDFKSENILITVDQHGHQVGKVSDFGATMKAVRQISKKDLQPYVTAQYCSPELLITNEQDASSLVTLSRKSDVWAVGVTIWNLYARSFAWIKAIDDEENVRYATYVRWVQTADSRYQGLEQPTAFKKFSQELIMLLCNTVQPVRKNRWELDQVIAYMSRCDLGA